MATYELPWEYSFPPFYTLQHHEETKKRQISVWADIVLKYYKSTNNNKLSISTSTLFKNDSIGRKVSDELALQIFESLHKSGFAHPIDKERNEWNLCWYTLDEYADMMYSWASETGHSNTICTLFELSSAKSEFSEVDEEILIKALRKLEERGKCELINMDGAYGVKFF
ncbi:vacuolar protein-sorting-associated protein 25 [Eupeodes corollae]|uniref:vacuolar protein-sorting-associated protein 25 n=1 Tax=Eupeodes corollae TaxID=290404 RepID=UPI00249326FB|nr:vacuolar protein-sorting-associated protein 25 [Eupeodes corollae]